MFKYPAYKYGGMVAYGKTGFGFYWNHIINKGLDFFDSKRKRNENDYANAMDYLEDQGYDEDELKKYAKTGDESVFQRSSPGQNRYRALNILNNSYGKSYGRNNNNNNGSEDNVTQIDENAGNETPVEENPAPVGGNGTGGSEIGGTPGEISGPAPGQGQGGGQGEGGYDIDALQALYQQFHDLFEQWGNSQNQSEETEEEPEEESEEEQTPALGRHDLMGLENWQLRSLRKGYGVDMGNGVTLKAANKKAGRQATRAIRRERRLDNMPFNVGTNTGTGFRYGPMTYSEE